MYKNLPSIATLNLLTQLQIKIRIAEFETVNYMVNRLENLDIRVGGVTSFIIQTKQCYHQERPTPVKLGWD